MRHKLVTRTSLFSEREKETLLTVGLLVSAFLIASIGSIPRPLSIGIVLTLGVFCAGYNIFLQIRNARRATPVIIVTANRWRCSRDSLDQIESYRDYSCSIPASEHQKGSNPKVSTVGSSSEFQYLIRVSEKGDITIYFPPAMLSRIGAAPPVKLSIEG